MSQRILIIGGGGFIGANLARHLEENNVITIVHRPTTSLDNLENIRCTRLSGDINNPSFLERAVIKQDIVFNLAACSSNLPMDRELRKRINIEGAGQVADAVLRTKKARLVHVSSVAAIGIPGKNRILDETASFNNSKDDYALSKHLGEQAVLARVSQGLDAVIACPANVVGAFAMKKEQRANFHAIASGKLRIYPPGGVCLVGVEDVIQGLVLCAHRGVAGHRYIIGGENIPYRKYFAAIAAATGGTAPSIRLPRLLIYCIGIIANMLCRMGIRPPLSRDTCDMIRRNLYFSSQRAVNELGYHFSGAEQVIMNTVHALALGRERQENR